jgi:hypothetical protein
MGAILRAFVTAVVIGVVVAVVAFALTSIHRNLNYLGGPCTEYKAFPYIDPWTGEWVSGLYVETSANVPPFGCSAPGRSFALDPPSDLAGIRAIPLPIGFTLGAAGALAAIILLRVFNPRARSRAG